jgi:adenine-specific DNA-methyltransferase
LPLEKRDPRLLYAIILYGFQQQIRFNTSHDFNNPVGMRWFNDKVLEKLISFSRVVKEKDCRFLCQHFTELEETISNNDFVYMDPPYRLTTGSYNDGKRGFKGWTMQTEQELLDFSDRLSQRGIKFMLSYVIEHDNAVNDIILAWVGKQGYRVIEVDAIPGKNRKEVLIVNYYDVPDSPLHHQKQLPKTQRALR